jgi:hypothetical protein
MMTCRKNTNGEVVPGTWKMVDLTPEKKVPMIVCSHGHLCTLESYQIQPSGLVLPLVLCPIDGCDFHEFVRLEGWIEQ